MYNNYRTHIEEDRDFFFLQENYIQKNTGILKPMEI